MNQRRALLRSMVAGLAAANLRAGGPDVQLKSRKKLSGRLEGMEATVVEIRYPPGGNSPEHRHPGFISGYVVEGRIRFGVEGQPEKVLGPGETFFEAAGALHSTSANADPEKQARIIAFSVAPAGSPLAIPK